MHDTVPFAAVFSVVCVAIILACDWVFEKAWSDAGTISRVWEAANERNWYVAGGYSYSAAGLGVHLFFPEYAAAGDVAIAWIKAVVFFLPILLLIWRILHSRTDWQPLHMIRGSRRLWLACEMIFGAVIGAIAASLLVSQHIS